MDRQAHERAAEAAAARADAELGLSAPAPARQASNLPEIIAGALESFGKPLAARLRRMDQRIDDEHAALIRHVDDELGRAVRDVRELNGDLNHQAERIAQKAADRSVAELRAEIRELRQELAEMKAGGGNIRVLR